ncbi:M56 family metallopeptidase [Homoserinibacter sp. YIM 151385]|uniref:M56 family metallopeptidase n=1 Tax=Homoserinibacter sp. YIM 151385 TaxID=2985506 RepID=UPI0022F11E43|nr:M56 family metallopeptidase [Homoserinibacter sp. YIM 151385]WBU38707.1 M56 family metallopeptidase [Homoserinibacter sp. YIM 151385]
MILAAAALAALAIALAVPVPVALSRAAWTRRAPASATLLWQAIALSGGLSMIGSLAVLGLSPFGDDLLDAAAGLAEAVRSGSGAAVVPTVALGSAALLLAHLLLTLVLTTAAGYRERARHRALAQLLSSPLRADARVIDDPAPVAYCVPGDGADSLTVVSAGLVDLLDEGELEAVIAHERAHLEQRHHLLTTSFQAWSLSLPWFPIASVARREVALLVELLADDRALRTASAGALRRAIALVAAPGRESAATARIRIERIGAAPLPLAARIAVGALAAGLLLVPTLLLAGQAVPSL